MKDSQRLTLFSAVSMGLAILFFAQPQWLPVPYGSMTFTFATLISLWVAYRLSQSPLRNASDEQVATLINTLKNYFLVMGIFFFFDAFPHVYMPAYFFSHPSLPASTQNLIAGHAHTFAHIFFFIGNAILIRIPVSFINARWKNAASILVAVLGVITVGYRFVHTDFLVSIAPNIPSIIQTDRVSGLLFAIVNVLSLLIPGIYIMYRGIRSTDHITRGRAILLGLGMAVFFSIGPVIDNMTGPYVQITIHTLQALSFYLMGVSAFYGAQGTVLSRPVLTPS